MLTHFGTLFALCHTVPPLTHFNTFNTPLTLLNFHKFDATKCFTWNGGNKMFHVEQSINYFAKCFT